MRARMKKPSKLQEQWKAVNIRAKYGPNRKPAKVVVRSLETGEVIYVVDQSKFKRGVAV